MVVVAIISIISTYAGVSFVLIAPKKLEAQTRSLANELSWARDLAASQHENFLVDFNVTNRTYTVYRQSVDPANFLEQRALEVDAVSVNPAPNQIQFDYPQGTSQLGKDITLTYQGQTRVITVFPETGYIRWE